VFGKLNVNSAEALLDAAVAGAGVAMVTDFVAWDAVRSGQLRLVLTDYAAPPTPVSVVYLPGRRHSARLRWFVETLRSIIPSPAPWEAMTRR
jgi:LysR family transcriptional regulator for bpeEF and oprC